MFDVVQSLDRFHVAHVLSDQNANDLPLIVITRSLPHLQVCSIRHLYASNRLRSSIFVITHHSPNAVWVDAFHTYTPLKVAVFSGTRSRRL